MFIFSAHFTNLTTLLKPLMKYFALTRDSFVVCFFLSTAARKHVAFRVRKECSIFALSRLHTAAVPQPGCLTSDHAAARCLWLALSDYGQSRLNHRIGVQTVVFARPAAYFPHRILRKFLQRLVTASGGFWAPVSRLPPVCLT